MIVPRYYEDLSVLHENNNASQSLLYSGIQKNGQSGGAQGRVRPNAVIERNLEVPVF